MTTWTAVILACFYPSVLFAQKVWTLRIKQLCEMFYLHTHSVHSTAPHDTWTGLSRRVVHTGHSRSDCCTPRDDGTKYTSVLLST